MTFTFGQPVYKAFESEGQATLDVIKNASSDYPQSITVSGMLPSGAVLKETLIFSPEEMLKTVVVWLRDDEVALEQKERYQVVLQLPTNHTRVLLGQYPSTVLEVLDDDGMSWHYLGLNDTQKLMQILTLFVY